MKKKLFSVVLFGVMTICLVACGNATKNSSSSTTSETNNESIVEREITEENSEVEMVETVHEHNYVENVVKEATCTEGGTVSYTCECGDTYDEKIESKGHDFGEYIVDGNASYIEDGTKTAKCSSCGETNTVADEGSKLSYTYTDGEAIKYAQQTVNLRDLPNTDGNKVGSLSTNDEVKITGTCNETGWYRIVYDDGVAYVSNKYLDDKKVEISATAPTENGNSSGSTSSSVPRAADYAEGVWHDMGEYFFMIVSPAADGKIYTQDGFCAGINSKLEERYPGNWVSSHGFYLPDGRTVFLGQKKNSSACNAFASANSR